MTRPRWRRAPRRRRAVGVRGSAFPADAPDAVTTRLPGIPGMPSRPGRPVRRLPSRCCPAGVGDPFESRTIQAGDGCPPLRCGVSATVPSTGALVDTTTTPGTGVGDGAGLRYGTPAGRWVLTATVLG